MPLTRVSNNMFANAVRSITTTATALASDELILASTTGGAYTLTLFTAAGNSGKRLIITKTTSDYSALTIDGDGSETVGGSTTTTLNTQGESITIMSDGSNWIVLNRYIPKSPLPSFSTLSIGATTSAPAKGGGAGFTDRSVGIRDGKYLIYRGEYYHLTAGTAGSGSYLITLPNSLTIDTSYAFATTTQASSGLGTRGMSSCGYGFVGIASSSYGEVTPFVYDSTRLIFMFHVEGSTSATYWSSSHFNMTNGDLGLSFEARIPISGWNG